MFKIIKNIDLITEIEKYDVILIGTNCHCSMFNGFQGKVRKKYPQVYYLNYKTKYGDVSKIGSRVTTRGSTPIFSLCFITRHYNSNKQREPIYLDYEALNKCMETANNEFQGLNVATTVMGGFEFDGNGDKREILKILKNNSSKMNLYVYDYKQYPSKIERRIIFKQNYKLCKGNKAKSKEIVEKQKEERSKLFSFEEPIGRKKRIRKEIMELLKKE